MVLIRERICSRTLLEEQFKTKICVTQFRQICNTEIEFQQPSKLINMNMQASIINQFCKRTMMPHIAV